MPMKWVRPEMACSAKGVCIYHVYKNDDYENRRSYWYSTSEEEGEGSMYEFDVRNLPGWDPKLDDDFKHHCTIIRAAIRAGLLKQDTPPAKEYRG